MTDGEDQELETWNDEIPNAMKTIFLWHDIFKQQLEFDKTKMEQQMEHELQMERMRIEEKEKTRSSNAKLPKLVITKFNGSPLDWLRFWNQFEAEIDKADVVPVTKFFYLNEFVDTR